MIMLSGTATRQRSYAVLGQSDVRDTLPDLDELQYNYKVTPLMVENQAEKRLLLLTGATGFIGTHTAQLLVQQGYRLRCLVRKSSDVSRLPKDVELAEGHLLKYESLQQAVRGCWGVIHVGGVIRVKQRRDFYLINRDGTANMVKAAREAGVERFLLCSSLAAAGPSAPDERREWDELPKPVTDYGKSKLAGEEAVQKGAGEMWYCIVRPPSVYGPWDRAFLTLVKWVRRGIKIKLGDGKMPFAVIHCADLARAMAMAIEADHPSGAIWFATDGRDHTVPEIMKIIEEALEKETRWVTIPEWVAPAVVRGIELFAEMRGGKALFSRDKLSELMQPAWTCNDEPFREATGYCEMFNLSDGLHQTVKWYKQQGWI